MNGRHCGGPFTSRTLGLAQGCALGRDAAWQRFVAQFRAPLTRVAQGLTRSATLREELADSLYGLLFCNDPDVPRVKWNGSGRPSNNRG
jgi:hypothetical protein